MTDAFHTFGSDLVLSATGDLLVADGQEESQQRVLRRLLTNLKDYLWQPDYGAGLPGKIGLTIDVPELGALIKAQMYLEDDVAHDPEPAIIVQSIPNGLSVRIQYTSIDTGLPTTLSFDVTP